MGLVGALLFLVSIQAMFADDQCIAKERGARLKRLEIGES